MKEYVGEPARQQKIEQDLHLKQERFENLVAAVRRMAMRVAQKSMQEVEEADKIDKDLNDEDDNEP